MKPQNLAPQFGRLFCTHLSSLCHAARSEKVRYFKCFRKSNNSWLNRAKAFPQGNSQMSEQFLPHHFVSYLHFSILTSAVAAFHFILLTCITSFLAVEASQLGKCFIEKVLSWLDKVFCIWKKWDVGRKKVPKEVFFPTPKKEKKYLLAADCF